MPRLPSGTLTFLFADLEGSTELLQLFGDERYGGEILAECRHLLRQAFKKGRGLEIDSQGDAFFVTFRSAKDGVTTAVAAQRAVAAHRWPEDARVRVRMGIHTGEPMRAVGRYTGLDIHRAARICAVGWGGQILLSQTTYDMIETELPPDITLCDLGQHRLKDLHRHEHIYQILHPDLPTDFPPLRSLNVRPNNLPVQLTSFVGRERELHEVRRLLSATRLLTLTGAGGCGKTRLALQSACELLDEYDDGVWLVDLVLLTEPALVPQRVAFALGVREEQARPLLATLRGYLQPKKTLLVLDNCEHLVTACATLARTLLQACPQLRILATSRQALDVPGGITWRVPSLSLPDLRRLFPRRMPPLENLMQYEAIRLFVERAAAALPSFSVTNQNAPALVEVCLRLDGIPLAIELAAARVNVLSVEQIAARLNERFRILTAGVQIALPRHQTLKAAIDWSYDLLTPQEQTLFGRLSVFAGGFTLEAAEAVLGGDGIETDEVLDLLFGLVNKSMVTTDEAGGEALRYRLLETLRDYGNTRLVDAGEVDMIEGRHTEFFLGLAEQAESELLGPDQVKWLRRLDVEHENLRAALHWCGLRAEAETGLRLSGALWRFWYHRGHFREGREHLVRALAVASALQRTALRAKALNGAGNLAYNQGDYAAARLLHEESLAIARELGDERGVARSLNNLALIAREQANYVQARELLGQALTINRAMDNREWEAINLNNLGLVARYQGDYPLARIYQEQSLAIQRDLADKWGIAMSLVDLGDVARDQGHHEEAKAFYEEGLAICRELRDRRGLARALDSLGTLALEQGDIPTARLWLEESLATWRELMDTAGTAHSLENFAALSVAQDQPERALRLAALASAVREELGAPPAPTRKEKLEQVLAAARVRLGPQASAAAWNRGREMTLEEAVADAVELLEHLPVPREQTSA